MLASSYVSLSDQLIMEKVNKSYSNPYFDFILAGIDIASKYNSAFLEAAEKSFESFLNKKGETQQKTQTDIRTSFDSTLRNCLNEDTFASSMANYVNAWTKIIPAWYDQFNDNFNFSLCENKILEPIRDTINRTPSEVIEMKGRFKLLHYKSEDAIVHKTPILVIYSLINRHYILDLLPKISVIKNLQRQGFDIYTTDWNNPTSYSHDLTLETYAEEYVGYAVEKIKEISGSKKVSLFGYCWGGIFALIYAAMCPQNVKNLILHATPTDIEKEETTIENWTTHLNVNNLIDAFGNVPGWFLNLAFVLRNPVEVLLKYPRYFSEPRNLDEIKQFFAIETWLYDSIPIIGEIYREIVEQVYRNNLLIKNKMKVGKDIIDLKNITMPVLNIVGTEDDLVPPSASKSVINVIGSTDKKLIEFPTGHVGLCISRNAHEKLWPEVGKWLGTRS
jgi:class III poly(R)-hydroxyalkanoic acid synthase PhaC subunit